MTTHRSYVKTIREMASGNWGQSFDTAEKAINHLTSQGVHVGDAALLEIVRKLEMICSALARDERNLDREKAYNENKTIPKWAKKIPGVSVGDFLYACDELAGGVLRSVVTYVQEDFVRVVELYPHFWEHVNAEAWADCDYHKTAADALKDKAQKDVQYHQPHLEYARSALKAIDDGADLTPFLDGKKKDDDDDDDDD
jgi:hypothetical protein